MTFGELAQRVDACARGLIAQGVGSGDRVGIFSYNRPEWVVADLAALSTGAIVVPVAYNLTSLLLKDILNDAEVKILFVENRRLLEIFLAIRENLRTPPRVVLFEGPAAGTECL
jgi:long-chain acyl-CoA synthetase